MDGGDRVGGEEVGFFFFNVGMGEELGHVESEVSIGHLCDLSASLLGLSIQSSVEACIHTELQEGNTQQGPAALICV